MKLYTVCKSCKNEIKIKSNASTRPDLQMERGDEFNINCHNCGITEKKHINDIKAQESNLIMLIGIGVGILATIILWMYFGAIGTISLTIPLIFWQQQMKAVKSFNSYTIRRK